MKIDRSALSTFASIAAGGLCASTLIACGGGGENKAISVSSIAKCAHASPESLSTLPADASSQRQVLAKTIKGGWLAQQNELSASSQAELQKQEATPRFDVYVFASNKTAEEAFTLIENAPHASEEWGAGGTFRRNNIIISTDQTPEGSLAAIAEPLLNKCAGAGASQLIERPQPGPPEGSEGTDTSTGETGLPPSANESSQGQSPVPGEVE